MNQYITSAYTELNDARKIEVLVEQLIKIIYNNELDTSDTMQLVDRVLELRTQVSED